MPIDRTKLKTAVVDAAHEALAQGKDAAVVVAGSLNAGLRFLADEIDALESRVATLDSRLAKAQQQQSATSKEVAALARRESGR